jgi:CBS domain-containing protein
MIDWRLKHLLWYVSRLRVGDVMRNAPLTVPPFVSAAAARELARAYGLKYVLVTDEGQLQGAACLDHLARACTGQRVEECICGSARIGALAPHLPLQTAAEIMEERAFRCLPVVAGPLFLGVVTGDDLRCAGVPSELATPTCSACGTRFHVSSGSRCVPLCSECLVRSEPPDSDEELGVAG